MSIRGWAGGRQRAGCPWWGTWGLGDRARAGCRRPPEHPHPHALPWQAFLLKLVQNLFAEGNDLFREKDYKQALVQYMEGLNVADYAASDQVALPRELLCKLHVNRAACYFTMVSSPHPLVPPTRPCGCSAPMPLAPALCSQGSQPQRTMDSPGELLKD